MRTVRQHPYPDRPPAQARSAPSLACAGGWFNLRLSQRGGHQTEPVLDRGRRDEIGQVGRVGLGNEALAAVNLSQPATLRTGHHLTAAKNPVLTVARVAHHDLSLLLTGPRLHRR